MPRSYYLSRIRTLLNEGFSDKEIRELCYDNPKFRPVYDKLAQNSGKDEIIHQLVEYADQKGLLDLLLTWAEEHNPVKYEEGIPYYGPGTKRVAPPGDVPIRPSINFTPILATIAVIVLCVSSVCIILSLKTVSGIFSSSSTPTPVQSPAGTATHIVRLASTPTVFNTQEAVKNTPTIVALETDSTVNLPLPTATDEPPVSTCGQTLPFLENFDSNQCKWEIRSDSEGTILISQGRLELAPSRYSTIWVPIPNVKIDGDFYVQAKVARISGTYCDTIAGLVVGEPNSGYKGFIIGHACGGNDYDYVAFLKNNSIIFSTPVKVGGLFDAYSPPRIIALEAVDGSYNFYIEGNLITSFPIEESYGDHIGLLAWDTGYQGLKTIITFDNIVVRNQK